MPSSYSGPTCTEQLKILNNPLWQLSTLLGFARTPNVWWGTQMLQLYLLRVVLFFVRRIVRDRFTWATMTHLTVGKPDHNAMVYVPHYYYFELKHPVRRFLVEEVHKYHRKRLPNIIYSLTKTMSHRSPPLPQCEQKQTTPYKTNGNET